MMPETPRTIVYIHGAGGSAEEAAHYVPLFPDCRVVGFDYHADTPWDARAEFAAFLDPLCAAGPVEVIANSLGAFFLLQVPQPRISRAWFLSPIVDMAALIGTMLTWAGTTEAELCRRGTIPTDFGQTLSWEYLCYVRSHPAQWTVPTHILCGEQDTMQTRETVEAFARHTGATLEIMPGGEHWFHTPEQMAFLDAWLRRLQ